MPAELMEVILCRDVYHCTPTQLKEVPITTVLRHLQVLSIEGQVQKSRQNRKRLK